MMKRKKKIIIAEPESNVKLECSATGYPLTSDTIKWSDEPIIKSSENSTVLSDRGIQTRIKNDVVKLDYVTWQGILTISEVVSKDFGEYICVARNEIGFDTFTVSFYQIVLLIRL
ncbi:nephrin [Caerostris extrusa]|uniref:Nephrin n=1 Tax=Caerostris extrusa TaxID=172846 RepID=A0AAV4NCD1_CAEEX|nr:nephrin [Caerostris extrusa]